jgi:hypothetical protein
VLQKFEMTHPSGYSIQTAPVLRDLSAWYHIMAVLDTTQATTNDRKIYLNGVQLTRLQLVRVN